MGPDQDLLEPVEGQSSRQLIKLHPTSGQYPLMYVLYFVSAIPIWLYWRIHAVDPASTAIILALVTIASTWLVAFSYRNTKHVIKHKVAVKREAAVTRDMNREVKFLTF